MSKRIIGEILEDGTVEKGSSDQGWIYKNPVVFDNLELDVLCYVPENDKDNIHNGAGYRVEYFIDQAGGNLKIARSLFNSVDWQHPGTYIEEQIDMGELTRCDACSTLYDSYDGGKCYCSTNNYRNIENAVHAVFRKYGLHYSRQEIKFAVDSMIKRQWFSKQVNGSYAVSERSIIKAALSNFQLRYHQKLEFGDIKIDNKFLGLVEAVYDGYEVGKSFRRESSVNDLVLFLSKEKNDEPALSHNEFSVIQTALSNYVLHYDLTKEK